MVSAVARLLRGCGCRKLTKWKGGGGSSHYELPCCQFCVYILISHQHLRTIVCIHSWSKTAWNNYFIESNQITRYKCTIINKWWNEGAVLGLPWKKRAVNLEMATPGDFLLKKGGGGAVIIVSKSVPKLKESAPPPDHVSITQLSRGHPVLSELYPNVS